MCALPLPVLRKSICGNAINPAVTANAIICSRSGHRMNNSPRIAAAARNTALFHIGSRPNTTPEKMNGRNVAKNGSAMMAVCSVAGRATDTQVVSVSDARTSFISPGAIEPGAVSANPVRDVAIVSVVARAFSRLAATAR